MSCRVTLLRGLTASSTASALTARRRWFAAKQHSLHFRFLSLPALSNAADSAPDESRRSHSPDLDVSSPVYMIWGANTGVGKTLVAAGLSASVLARQKSAHDVDSAQSGRISSKDVLYIKPLQTGYPNDSDARFVTRQVFNILKSGEKDVENKVHIHNQTLQGSPPVRRALQLDLAYSAEGIGMTMLNACEEKILDSSHRPNNSVKTSSYVEAAAFATDRKSEGADCNNSSSHLSCTTMWAWFDPVSPHLAARNERAEVGDSSVRDALTTSIQQFARSNFDQEQDGATSHGQERFKKWTIVETAGGVASPGPSGTLQCDIYRPLRLPCVLVGDARLGGISTTISSFESLFARGYDIEAVVLLESDLGNDQALLKYLRGRVPVFVLPSVPSDSTKDLVDWFVHANGVFKQIQTSLEDSHARRIQRLREMPGKAEQILWWPFTQHSMVPMKDVTVIDSRCGDKFSVFESASPKQGDVLAQQFDACASWWTQGPDECLQPELAKEVGHAAARYGHVMFPENVHEPALGCAELLLQGVGKGWAKRVYYSDNGSTAIEIALKMAFRKFLADRGLATNSANPRTLESPTDLKVLALRGSYHGDTLGAMEAQAPNPYTGFLQQPWYTGRGLFLDPPTVFLQNGRWLLQCPASYGDPGNAQDLCFESREDIFSSRRDSTRIGSVYQTYISQQLSQQRTKEGTAAIAALIIEPIIHGSGGMQLIDPLFQRILANECRRLNIPVIFDEIFAGCWRLGVESAASLLNCSPDIGCYGKLLTGGTVPLAATIATEDVFEVFRGNSKLDALLHGHSYSAHAVGCAAARTSLKHFSDPAANSNLLSNGRLQELWNPELVLEISSHPSIQRVVSLGTVFACELQAGPTASGYASTVARDLILTLRKDGIYARPLGNVVYLMCGPLTPPETCSNLLETFSRHLG